MKILIVSDTHGRHQALDRALEEAGKIDMEKTIWRLS